MTATLSSLTLLWGLWEREAAFVCKRYLFLCGRRKPVKEYMRVLFVLLQSTFMTAMSAVTAQSHT